MIFISLADYPFRILSFQSIDLKMNLKEVITILISRFQKKDINFLVGEGSKEAIWVKAAPTKRITNNFKL